MTLQAQAQDWLARAKAADDAGKQALVAELARDSRLTSAVVAAVKREQQREDPDDRALLSLSVEDGARARAIVQLVRRLPEAERLSALHRMRKSGVLNEKVFKDVIAGARAPTTDHQ